MNTNDKATKTPWQSWPTGFDFETIAVGPNGKTPILKTLGGNAEINKANATLIVQAVNEHAALNAVAEAAEKAVRKSYLRPGQHEDVQIHPVLVAAIKDALAALARARESGVAK